MHGHWDCAGRRLRLGPGPVHVEIVSHHGLDHALDADETVAFASEKGCCGAQNGADGYDEARHVLNYTKS